MAPLLLRRFMERQFREPRRQDPYRTESKPFGTPRCPSCNGVNIRGKWYAEDAAISHDASVARKLDRLPEELCPACRQLQDHYAMGVVELHGESWKKLESQVRGTIENSEMIARSRNDQERLLWSKTDRGVTKFYVTLPELARHIGRTLENSFKGSVEYHHSSEEPYLRVIWNSDAKAEKRRTNKELSKSRHSRNRGGRGSRVTRQPRAKRIG